MAKSQVRLDIQVLRAIAISAVVIYHTGLGLLPGGYLGVDVFFVVSGFLIGKVIMTSCDANDFSFAQFYKRRALRLLPATISTLVITSILAAFVLTYSDWLAYQRQLLAAVTFTANFALYFEIDYFAAAADRMPLLHMWSLSVEEQFYLFAPVVILLTPRRWRSTVFLLFAALSLLACLVLIFGWVELPLSSKNAQSIAFYMLPTRAWELIMGCIGAWFMLQSPRLRIAPALKWCALIGIIALTLRPIGTIHPAQDALIVTSLTLLLLLGQDDWIRVSTASGIAKKIGDWSYSIYLVHWPLFAFANNIFIEGTPPWVSLAIVVASIGLGAAQYALVEKPFRNPVRTSDLRATAGLATSAIALSMVHFLNVANVLHPADERIATARPSRGLSPTCNQNGNTYVDQQQCRTSDQPRVAVFGDSIAMQWASALQKDADRFGGLVQITKSACAPTIGVAQVHGSYTQGWADDCIGFVNDSFEWIIATESVEVVVVSSLYRQVLMDFGQSLSVDGRLARFDGGLGLEAAKKTLSALTTHGKSVVLIGTPAMTGADFGACQHRRITGAPTVSADNCSFALQDFKSEFGPLHDGLLQMGAIEGVKLLWPHEAYCAEQVCQTKLGDAILYADRAHLSLQGSAHVSQALGLPEILAEN